jgi:hypothetical protein
MSTSMNLKQVKNTISLLQKKNKISLETQVCKVPLFTKDCFVVMMKGAPKYKCTTVKYGCKALQVCMLTIFHQTRL